MEIRNRKIVEVLLKIACSLGNIDVIVVPPGSTDGMLECDDCGGLTPSDNELNEILQEDLMTVADMIDVSYVNVPGFKSVSINNIDNTIVVYATERDFIKYFPKNFAGVPVQFILNGVLFTDDDI